MKPAPLTDSRLTAGSFVGQIGNDDLVYFCLNVGDADAQVIVLPAAADGKRRVVIVDAGVPNKVVDLLDTLVAANLIDPPSTDDPGSTDATIALVVATHPHNDHIAGMPQLFDRWGANVAEFWEPGFFHPSSAYGAMLSAISARPDIVYTQPTSGLRRFFGPVAITVLSPSVHLRNRFDTYGVEINDSSIALHIEHPARGIADQASVGGGQGNFSVNATSAALVLGADAQTLSWSFVANDFPYLAASGSAQAKAIGAATGRDLLSASVLKVSHHASKHGVNLELVERINPRVTLVSSTSAGKAYGFPHSVTQELIREALNPVAGKVNAAGATVAHKSDEDLRLFYTCDVTDAVGEPPAGSFGVITRGRRLQVWRFGDEPAGNVDLVQGRRWS